MVQASENRISDGEKKDVFILTLRKFVLKEKI